MPTLPIPQPTLSEADWLGEVYDLILHATGIDENKLIRGNQSRMVLPSSGNYCIFTPIIRRRVGTNASIFTADKAKPDKDGDDRKSVLLAVDIQLDFYGPDADKLAQMMEIFVNSLDCLDYEKKSNMGIRVMTCTQPQDATRIDDTRQYINRWYVVISVSVLSTLTQKMPWFDSVDFTLKDIKNVDVFFKP